MKITILNGDMDDGESEFTVYIEKLSENLRQQHAVTVFALNKMNLHYCTGCWSCWWKTPGKCAINDDAGEILRSVVDSDFLIFASPLMVGFTSSALKKITDRFVALLHPYIKMKEGECHHLTRYEKYPDFGLVLKKEKDTDDEDIAIVNDIYERLSINFHGAKNFIKFIDNTKMEEIVYETNHI